MSDTDVLVTNEHFTATPWLPTSGWIASTREPGCFFRTAERTVTRTWTQRIGTLGWGQYRCYGTDTLRGSRCVKMIYEQVRDKHGMPTSESRMREYSYPASREPEWKYGPPEERSEVWIESRFEVWRWPDLSKESVELRAPYSRLIRGDAPRPLPDAKLRRISVDGNPIEVMETFLTSEFRAGPHEVVMENEIDRVIVTSHLTVHLLSRVYFGTPSIEGPTKDEGALRLTVPLTNRSSGDVVLRTKVTDVSAGWLVHVVGEPFLRLRPTEMGEVILAAFKLSELAERDEPTCSVSAIVVTDEADAVEVAVPLSSPRQTAVAMSSHVRSY